MNKQSKWIGSDSWNRGQQVEKDFERLLVKRDPDFKRATQQQQFLHIDFLTSFGSIDVKAKKRLQRAASMDEEKVWLEFRNVRGKTGWLTGCPDIIAFERDDCFILVKRLELLKLANALCNLDDKVSMSSQAMYKGYTRKDRQDLLSVIKMSDIVYNINHRRWDK